MGNKSKNVVKQSRAYREESVRIPIIISFLIVILVSAPLVWMIVRINQTGLKLTDVTKYQDLAEMVDRNLRTVDALFRDDEAELARIRKPLQQETITLKIPEIQIVEEKADVRPEPLQVDLRAIYWNDVRPLVGIGNENYGIGDKILGYEIVRIERSRVYFRGADGTAVVKDFDEDIKSIR